MKRAFVSVVIPSYNHAAYVAEAIASVAAQENADIELIVVDDGSSDGSPGVVEKTIGACGPARAELIVQANGGAHAAINRGLAQARGDFVQILNSDDRLHPRRVATLVAALERDRGELAFSECSILDERGKKAAAGHPMTIWYRTAWRAMLAETTLGFGLLKINAAVTTSNFLFRRSLVDRIGGFTPERLCHDWRFMLRALLIAEPVLVHEELIDYRFHGSNTAPRVMASRRAEGETSLREYLAAAIGAPPANRKAPSPFWWPGFFPFFLETRRCWFANEPLSAFAPRLKDFAFA